MTKLEKLIAEHKLAKEETWEQLNELSKIDTTKFSEKEKKDIEVSVQELQQELSLRNCFLSDLNDLL